MTNAIQTAITNALPGTDALSTAVRDVSSMSNEGLFAAALFALNVILKKTPKVQNWTIPYITAGVGAAAYGSLMGFSPRNVIIGIVCGSVSVHAHQLVKQITSGRKEDTVFLKKDGQ